MLLSKVNSTSISSDDGRVTVSLLLTGVLRQRVSASTTSCRSASACEGREEITMSHLNWEPIRGAEEHIKSRAARVASSTKSSGCCSKDVASVSLMSAISNVWCCWLPVNISSALAALSLSQPRGCSHCQNTPGTKKHKSSLRVRGNMDNGNAQPPTHRCRLWIS